MPLELVRKNTGENKGCFVTPHTPGISQIRATQKEILGILLEKNLTPADFYKDDYDKIIVALKKFNPDYYEENIKGKTEDYRLLLAVPNPNYDPDNIFEADGVRLNTNKANDVYAIKKSELLPKLIEARVDLNWLENDCRTQVEEAILDELKAANQTPEEFFNYPGAGDYNAIRTKPLSREIAEPKLKEGRKASKEEKLTKEAQKQARLDRYKAEFEALFGSEEEVVANLASKKLVEAEDDYSEAEYAEAEYACLDLGSYEEEEEEEIVEEPARKPVKSYVKQLEDNLYDYLKSSFAKGKKVADYNFKIRENIDMMFTLKGKEITDEELTEKLKNWLLEKAEERREVVELPSDAAEEEQPTWSVVEETPENVEPTWSVVEDAPQAVEPTWEVVQETPEGGEPTWTVVEEAAEVVEPTWTAVQEEGVDQNEVNETVTEVAQTTPTVVPEPVFNPVATVAKENNKQSQAEDKLYEFLKKENFNNALPTRFQSQSARRSLALMLKCRDYRPPEILTALKRWYKNQQQLRGDTAGEELVVIEEYVKAKEVVTTVSKEEEVLEAVGNAPTGIKPHQLYAGAIANHNPEIVGYGQQFDGVEVIDEVDTQRVSDVEVEETAVEEVVAESQLELIPAGQEETAQNDIKPFTRSAQRTESRLTDYRQSLKEISGSPTLRRRTRIVRGNGSRNLARGNPREFRRKLSSRLIDRSWVYEKERYSKRHCLTKGIRRRISPLIAPKTTSETLKIVVLQC